MEAEIRAILTAAVSDADAEPGLIQVLRNRFGALGGVELQLPGRAEAPRPGILPR